jgi:predicted ATP-dependent serine protease
MENLSEDIIIKSFQTLEEKTSNAGGFIVDTMNHSLQTAHKLPPLNELYPMIILEGDLVIIFGQSGIGKTIFSMQIARDIAAKGKRVLYVDFEMTLRQLALRYCTANFPPTFYRAEIDRDNPAEDILKGIEIAACANMAEVVFIDNITALGQSLDKGVEAGTLMTNLNNLKKQYGWTLIVLNHVPKMYSGAVPLFLSAVQGSAKLNQFVDDAIGIAQSYIDTSLVYVKQCKWRNGEVKLNADNVALFERSKDESGNLCFIPRGYGREADHLKQERDGDRDVLKEKVQELYAGGRRQTDIAAELGISQAKVSRLLQE